MKIVITGSLGNIGRPLTKELVQKAHTVTVISSKADKQKEIDALGAAAAIGTLEDADFLAKTFKGADAVYCMIPPNHFAEADPIAYYRRIAANYSRAIRESGVKRVVHLSTYGADLDKGTGLILGSHNAEKIFNELPEIALTHMRPTYFYYNLLGFVQAIKTTGTMPANYGQDKLVLVSPIDIAAAIADEIATPLTGHKVRYVASDEHTGNEIAAILGAAIGKPDIKWVIITDEEMRKQYEGFGLPAPIAAALVEMFVSLRTGRMASDYHRYEPGVKGKVKLKDYAKEFAAIFNQS